ncbi:BTAD domain-containing putative transcriptional regulator [Lentzea albida]|uniref:BTAD domain-containing putative transcriptional regulator n=1 Tax=Lentzea albida TaxID=65499 RepID=UPI0015A69D2C|nr:BTAD domain-containing putative transcriptional regulator [Lentzea albida]
MRLDRRRSRQDGWMLSPGVCDVDDALRLLPWSERMATIRAGRRAGGGLGTEIRILGGLHLVRGDNPVTLTGARQRAMLGYLTLHPGKAISVDRLIHVVWGDTPPRHARHSVHQRIHELRRKLSASGAESTDVRWEPGSGGYRLVVDPSSLDAAVFRARAAAALDMAGRSALTAAVSEMRHALALWRGRVLEGVPSLTGLSEIEALENERLEALDHLWEWELRLGRHAAVLPEIGSLVRAEPLREQTFGLLLMALEGCGRRTEALSAYADFRSTVRAELGAEPGRWLQEIHRALLQDPEPVPPAAGDTGLAVDRDGTAFTGRRTELSLLLQIAENVVSSGSAHLLTVLGEPGIGKTSLVREVLTLVRTQVKPVWTARCAEEQPASAFTPLAEMVAGEAQILVSDTPEQATAKLADFLPGIDPAPRALLAGTLGITRTTGLEAKDVRHAWDLVFRDKTREPLVLVVEDVHWAREELLTFLEDLALDLAARPLLIVCTSRLDLLTRHANWPTGTPGTTVLTLGALDDVSAWTITTGLLPDASQEQRERVVVGAGGNPLFLQQLANAAHLDQGGLDAVPPTLEKVINARWNALPADDLIVLRAAAVVGDVVWAGAIDAVGAALCGSGAPLPNVPAAVRRLCRLGFLRRSRSSIVKEEQEFHFTHAALRAIGYEGIEGPARAAGHLRAAAWWQELPHGRGIALGEAANHYQRAIEALGSCLEEGVRLRAMNALHTAAEFAMEQGDYATAVDRLTTALTLAEAGSADRGRLLLDLGESLHHSAAEGASELEEAGRLLARWGRPAPAAKANLFRGWAAWTRGDGTLAERFVRRAVTEALGLPVSETATRVLSVGSALLAIMGHHAEATIAADCVAESSQGSEDHRLLGNRGIVRLFAGSPDAIYDFRAAVASARRNGFTVRPSSWINMISYHTTFGDLPAATQVFREAEATSGYRYTSVDCRWLWSIGIRLRFWSGELDLLEIADFVPQGNQVDSEVIIVRARMRALEGDWVAAAEDAGLAVQIAERTGSTTSVFTARCVRAAFSPDVDPVRGLLTSDRPVTYPAEVGVLLPMVLIRAGSPEALADFGFVPSPWLSAAEACIAGDHRRAVRRYRDIGSAPDARWAIDPTTWCAAG